MLRVLTILAICLAIAVNANADDAKPTSDNPDLAAAEQLYRSGRFAEAAERYQAILKTDSTLVPAQTGLMRALLRQQKIDEASAVASKALAAQPNSAALLAATGDVQFRLAEMAAAQDSYLKALKADPKELHAYLGLVRLYRAYSLYRRAYEELKAAYAIAPNDPEVQRLWFQRLGRRERIKAIEAYLAGAHPDNPEETESLERYLDYLKATADQPVHACKLLSKVERTDTKLDPVLRDSKHILGYGLAVKLNDRNSHLLLDTGASGILVGRKFAEKAGLKHISDSRYYGIGDKGAQTGYLALADRIRVGELEFADCVVHVTDRMPLSDEDGLIGADVFSSYLVDIDFPDDKLRLSPLPKRPDDTAVAADLNSEGESDTDSGDKADDSGNQPAEANAKNTATPAPASRIPKDRYVAPEMKDWTPVFRFGHDLLVTTWINDSKPMLFLIDTGSSSNILSTRAGREVGKISPDRYMQFKGLSGNVADVYRADNATLKFGHFAQKNQAIATFDLSNISRHTGTEVSGILGFQLLVVLQVKIDYRDGLVDFGYDPKRWHTDH